MEESSSRYFQIAYYMVVILIVLYFLWLSRVLMSAWIEFRISILWMLLLVTVLLAPWIFFLLYYYEIHIKTIDILLKELSKLPISKVTFFSILVVTVLFLFLIPVVTPLFSFVFFVIILPYLIAKKRRKGMIIFILLALLSFVSLAKIVILFYLTITKWSLRHFTMLFQDSIEISYIVSSLVVAAGSIGDFTLLIYEGAKQYDPTVVIPRRKIYLMEIIFFVMFALVYLYLPQLFPWLYIPCLGILAISNIIRWFKGINRVGLGGKITALSVIMYTTIFSIESFRYLSGFVNYQIYVAYQALIYFVGATVWIIVYFIIFLQELRRIGESS